MTPLLIAILSGTGFIAAYHIYGKWLGGKIFALSAKAICPSLRLKDGADFVPTKRGILFGHHFTSIAGTGPIVGPAIAIMWGWLPALLWVVLGSIFIGAVHDLGALVVSIRNNGQTLGDIAGRLLNKRVRLLFLMILVMALTLVLAIFGLVIAGIFGSYPSAIFPCLIQIPLAIGIGILLHRKGTNILFPSLIVLTIMYLSVFFGDRGWLSEFNQTLAQWPVWNWVVALLLYSYLASVLPVWTLLQPRDYINALQLISALGLIILGLIAATIWGGSTFQKGLEDHFEDGFEEVEKVEDDSEKVEDDLEKSSRPSLEMIAPMIDLNPKGAPVIFPFLFITIACGAISGFHCLVSSGTSSKQLKNEPDARFVGYGGMLTEGFLATLVLLSCGAGLGLGLIDEGKLLLGEEAWKSHYGSWGDAHSLSAKVSAFVDGSSNFLQALGLSASASIALMGVLVASFAGTTLDTACRLQRYVIQELATVLTETKKGKVKIPLTYLKNKHGASLFAISIAAALAAVPPDERAWTFADAGSGGMLLWPLFGATNQLLAGLAFIVIAFHLWRRGRPIGFLIFPMFFMMLMPFWAMFWQVFIGSADHPSWASQGKILLSSIGISTMLLEIWMIVEALKLFPKVKGVIEKDALDIKKIGESKIAKA